MNYIQRFFVVSIVVAAGSLYAMEDVQQPPFQQVAELQGGEKIQVLALSSSGRYVAAGTYNNGLVKVWDTENVTQEPLIAHGHAGFDTVTSLAFSPIDDTTLASGSTDESACLWRLNFPKKQAVAIKLPNTHRVCSVAFAPDGKHVAVGAEGGSIKIWPVTAKDGEQSRDEKNGFFSSALTGLMYSPDNKYIIAHGYHLLNIFSTEKGQRNDVVRLERSDPCITSLTVLPDGTLLRAVCDGDNNAMEIEEGGEVESMVRFQKLSQVISGKVKMFKKGVYTSESKLAKIQDATLSPDGKHFATSFKNACSMVVAPVGGKHFDDGQVFNAPAYVDDVAFSKDSATAAFVQRTGIITVLRRVQAHPPTL